MMRTFLISILVLFATVCDVSAQSCTSYPNTLTNGTTADANQVMANFNYVGGCVRGRLTSNLTYYVRTDGNDSNNGLTNTAGGAFLTVQKAVNVVSNNLDLSGFVVTIQVGNGTYTNPIVLLPLTGNGSVTIKGDSTTPSNVVFSVTGNTVISGTNFGSGWQLSGVKLTTTTSGHALNLYGMSSLTVTGKVEFGTVGTSSHVVATDGGHVIFSSPYTISGGANLHFVASRGGTINSTGVAVTLSGTPAFTTFAASFKNAVVTVTSMTFTGSATGQRYVVDTGGGIDTAGGGASYLPGSTAGTATAPGWYN